LYFLALIHTREFDSNKLNITRITILLVSMLLDSAFALYYRNGIYTDRYDATRFEVIKPLLFCPDDFQETADPPAADGVLGSL